MKSEYSLIQTFSFFIIVNTLGMFTQVFQKLTIFRVKDNVTLNLIQMCLEASIATVGILFIMTWNTPITNRVVSETCGKAITVGSGDANMAD